MNRFLHAKSAPVAPEDAGTSSGRAETMRCDICKRRLGSTISYLEETGDVPGTRQSWMLCTECSDAVHEQIERAPVRSPMRLRIAIGVVSTERTPVGRRSRRAQFNDNTWIKVLFWLFLITMLVHLAIIVAIAGIVK